MGRREEEGERRKEKEREKDILCTLYPPTVVFFILQYSITVRTLISINCKTQGISTTTQIPPCLLILYLTGSRRGLSHFYIRDLTDFLF